MFDKIWKEQITKPKGKLGIWKPKEELKPREDNSEECCEKAREYWISKRLEEYASNREVYIDKNPFVTQQCEMFLKDMKNWFLSGAPEKYEYFSKLEKTARETLKIYDDCRGK
jgi:hypothetical protein